MKKTSFVETLTLGLILALTAVMLFWNLTARYLWQDEAATAVLAVRMMHFGRPMAYDGKNLLTIDIPRPQMLQSTADNPDATVAHFAELGDFKPDYTWKWHPWGLFLVAAAGIKLLGQNTLGARLPFALAAFATVPLLFRFVRRQFDSFLMAAIAALLMVTNSYWILHARQSRYYALDGLALMVALWTFARWQWGRGPAWFIAAIWCWFQMDYGTVLPVIAVLFIEALVENPHLWRRTLKVALIVAVTLAPFAYYYDILGRKTYHFVSLLWLFGQNLFNMNEYVAALLLVVGAVVLLMLKGNSLPVAERRTVTLCTAIYGAFLIWIPAVAPDAFVRYCIVIFPAAAIAMAWLFVRLLPSPWMVCAAAAVAIFTPWFGLPAGIVAPPQPATNASRYYRRELVDMYTDIFGNMPDPNRLVIEYLRANAAPTDEILINYEDIPLMYYLPNPIRGGIIGFRVSDTLPAPPRFVVLRRSVPFVPWDELNAEVARYQWERIPLKAPDIAWGNLPDPRGHLLEDSPPDLYIARRVGP